MMELTKQASLDDILPAARELSAHDKLVLIRILAEELTSGVDLFPFKPGETIELWSPIEAYGAAEVLRQALAEEETREGEKDTAGQPMRISSTD